MNYSVAVSLVFGFGASIAFGAPETFKPVLGDEATYEVTTPVGSQITRRVIEAYDANSQNYTVALYVDNNGQQQKQTDLVAAEKLEALYILDIERYCAALTGTLTQVTFDRETWTACQTVKDNGILRQEDFWVAGIPFGSHNSFKKSPLHPKAGTATRLMSFKLVPR
jgi:hypothetical protein